MAFGSSVVTMFYKASITSALSVRRQKYPFNDLESMVASDYKYASLQSLDLKSEPKYYPCGLVMKESAGFLMHAFNTGPKDALFRQIGRKFYSPKDMDKSYYPTSLSMMDGIKNSHEKLAGFLIIESVTTSDDYKKILSCHLALPWGSKHPNFNKV